MAEWLSSWLAEQEDRGSIPGLFTWIFRDWLSPASKSRYGWKIAKSTLLLKNNQQPTKRNIAVHRNNFSGVCLSACVFVRKSHSHDVIFTPFHHYVLQVTHAFLGILGMLPYLYLSRFSAHEVKYRCHKTNLWHSTLDHFDRLDRRSSPLKNETPTLAGSGMKLYNFLFFFFFKVLRV